jgi:hypothetical protein
MAKANFEYSYNKTLESHSRLSFLEKALASSAGSINSSWVLNMLASHTDSLVGERSYGRTVTKAYGTMTHIMEPEKGMFWASMGDVYPSPHSTHVGFQVDFNFDKNNTNPFQIVGFQKAEHESFTQKPNWTESLAEYTLSYMAFRDGGSTLKGLEESYKHASNAIALAKEDGVFEVPYHYVRARIGLIAAGHSMAQQDKAKALAFLTASAHDLDAIIAQRQSQTSPVVDYEVGLAHMWRARIANLMREQGESGLTQDELSRQSRKHYEEAKQIFEHIITTQKRTFFVKRLLKGFYDANWRVFKKYTAKQSVSEDIDFITME